MNEHKHTPGPWELRDADNGPHIVARLPENEGKRWDDPVICNLYDDVTPEDSVTIGPWLETLPNALANARLIVAAPELLEALSELVKWCDVSGLSAVPGDGTEYSVIRDARAAIAKAKGETES